MGAKPAGELHIRWQRRHWRWLGFRCGSSSSTAAAVEFPPLGVQARRPGAATFCDGGAVKLTGDDLLKAAGTRTLKSSSSIGTVVKLRVRSLLSKPSPEKGAGDRTVVTREEMEALVADEETRQGGDDEAMAPAATAAAAEQAAPAWSKAAEHGSNKQPVGDGFGAGSGGGWVVDDVAAVAAATGGQGGTVAGGRLPAPAVAALQLADGGVGAGGGGAAERGSPAPFR